MGGKKICVIPTMGFLHTGHASLIEHARTIGDMVVTTIFVNPAQFGVNEDFERYPRDLQQDEKIAAAAGSDVIFCPETAEMYPEGFKTFVETERVSKILEGRFRPTHFRGVTTVVAKLFNIVKPNAAIFGQKDAQQAFILKQMARDLNFDIEILTSPIVREPDGLAMSSRNVYLSSDERRNATVLYRSLKHAERRIGAGERSVQRLITEMRSMIQDANPTEIDYVSFVRPDMFEETDSITFSSILIALAVRFGKTRLIDNNIVQVGVQVTKS